MSPQISSAVGMYGSTILVLQTKLFMT